MVLNPLPFSLFFFFLTISYGEKNGKHEERFFFLNAQLFSIEIFYYFLGVILEILQILFHETYKMIYH